MASRRTRKSMSLAAQAVELGIAAPQVIAYRLAKMASAGATLSPSDSAEFMRMGSEKIEAANESWAAMANQAFLENQKLAIRMAQSFWGMGRSPGARQVNDAAMRILGKGMAPVHRRAVANAKRLSRG